MTVSDVSERGRAFVRRLEGCPLTAYRDITGVPTIGDGATNRSRIATAYLKSIGVMDGRIVPGKTKITQAQADEMFAAMLDHEYEPMVIAKMPAGTLQHQFDAATSGTWNLGARFMGWGWADLWRAGRIHDAAAYLASHYNTAGGRKVAGLVRRRKAEAKLFEFGDYGDGASLEGEPRTATTKPAEGDPVVKEAQELLTARGFNPGAIDGWMGEKTRAAVIAYQRAHPDLVADGIIGPATMAQLRRDAVAVKEVAVKGASAAASSGALSFAAGLPWAWIAAGVALIVVAYVVWRYRDVWTRRKNTVLGKEAVA